MGGARPLLVFTTVTRPLIGLLNGFGDRLLRLVKVEPVEELRSARTPDELASVVRRAGVQGALGIGDGGVDGTLAELQRKDRRRCHDTPHPPADRFCPQRR